MILILLFLGDTTVSSALLEVNANLDETLPDEDWHHTGQE